MKKGFTLIETMIYIAILSMAMVGFVTFIMSISAARNKNYAVLEVEANTRQSMEIISQKIRDAADIKIASSTFSSNPGVLTLITTTTSTNPTIIDLTGSSGSLRVTVGTSSPVIITSNKILVSNLIFYNYTGTSRRKNIGIAATFSYSNPSNDINYNYSESVRSDISLH
jgi:prepilin-type N-terminal cleavage/methylation domain-containing protein